MKCSKCGLEESVTQFHTIREGQAQIEHLCLTCSQIKQAQIVSQIADELGAIGQVDREQTLAGIEQLLQSLPDPPPPPDREDK